MVTDAYPPLRTSCAVQMYDLGQAFIEEGHQVTIITPSTDLQEKIRIQMKDGVRLVQVRALMTKDVNYVYRTLAEFINPFLIWHKLKKSPEFLNTKYDGIIWYSPTIFWGPLIKGLKQRFHLKAYLILRDIFPDWALDLGIIKKGIIYRFLKVVEKFQYKQADTIGVQSPNNLNYFKRSYPNHLDKVETLWNWIGPKEKYIHGLNLNSNNLKGRFIYTYIGNMGVAQNMDLIIDLAERFQKLTELSEAVGFLLVGRGSEVKRLKILIEIKQLKNIALLDEVSMESIPSLLQMCDVGMISLDPRLCSHNIPGKFLSYVREGIPVLAAVNAGNDLIDLIDEYGVGEVIVGNNIDEYEKKAISLYKNANFGKRDLNSLNPNLLNLFSSKRAQSSITNSLLK
jgi:glycosyltransferase involved in cell wall biosynthesis